MHPSLDAHSWKLLVEECRAVCEFVWKFSYFIRSKCFITFVSHARAYEQRTLNLGTDSARILLVTNKALLYTLLLYICYTYKNSREKIARLQKPTAENEQTNLWLFVSERVAILKSGRLHFEATITMEEICNSSVTSLAPFLGLIRFDCRSSSANDRPYSRIFLVLFSALCEKKGLWDAVYETIVGERLERT